MNVAVLSYVAMGVTQTSPLTNLDDDTYLCRIFMIGIAVQLWF